MIIDLANMFPFRNAEVFDFLEMFDFNNCFEDLMFDEYYFIRDMLSMGFTFYEIISW